MRASVKATLLLIAACNPAPRAGEFGGEAIIAGGAAAHCFVDCAENLPQPKLPDDDKPIVHFEGTVRDEQGRAVAGARVIF